MLQEHPPSRKGFFNAFMNIGIKVPSIENRVPSMLLEHIYGMKFVFKLNICCSFMNIFSFKRLKFKRLKINTLYSEHVKISLAYIKQFKIEKL